MAQFEHLEELVVGLYDRGALRFSDFEWTLKSGRKSPVYYNQRPITSFQEGLVVNEREMPVEDQKWLCDLAVTALAFGIDQLEMSHNHIHGIPQASTVIGGYVARERDESYIWERLGEKKGYGVSAQMEGNFNPGDNVAVVDDVVTDAASKIETIKSLQENELNMSGIVAMIDREEGGGDNLAKAGMDFVPIVGLSAAVRILQDNKKIGSEAIDWVTKYHEGLRADGIKTSFNPSAS